VLEWVTVVYSVTNTTDWLPHAQCAVSTTHKDSLYVTRYTPPSPATSRPRTAGYGKNRPTTHSSLPRRHKSDVAYTQQLMLCRHISKRIILRMQPASPLNVYSPMEQWPSAEDRQPLTNTQKSVTRSSITLSATAWHLSICLTTASFFALFCKSIQPGA
jgi:hypothetical protein